MNNFRRAIPHPQVVSDLRRSGFFEYVIKVDFQPHTILRDLWLPATLLQLAETLCDLTWQRRLRYQYHSYNHFLLVFPLKQYVQTNLHQDIQS